MSDETPGTPRDDTPDSRFGYVAVVGRPNVGKSTLMNAILGQKLSIVTAKPQTTRQRIVGIHTTDSGQVVFVDTPGIHAAAGKALNRYMNRVALAAIRDVDAVLFLIEAGRWTAEDRRVADALDDANLPVFLVINKIDRLPDKAELLPFLEEIGAGQRFDQVFMVSALKGDGLTELENAVTDVLPFSRPYYDEDQITDRSERFLAAELIREQLMNRLHQELPYAVAVEVERFEREPPKHPGAPGLIRIGAIVWVERDSQKQIVIGKGGAALKQVGSGARRAMEALFDEKVFLNLWVKVSREWSDSEQRMARFGYDEA